MTFPLDANTVRQFMDLNTDGTSKYTDTTINSNLRTALALLERETGRRLGDISAAYKFSTDGATSLIIPGLRTATSVTRAGAALTADASYWLQPDRMQTGVYTGIQFQSYRVPGNYYSTPEWFDRGLDFGLDRYRFAGSVPNDLVITGSWGYADASWPDDALMAHKVLAAYLTKLPDANSSGYSGTLDTGHAWDLSNWPELAQKFIADYSVLSVGGIGSFWMGGTS